MLQGISAQKSVDKLINSLKKDKAAYALTLPGWLLRSGFDAVDHEDLKYEPGFNELANGIKKLRVLYLNREASDVTSRLNEFVQKIKDRDGYEDYAIVKSEDGTVRVIVKEKDNKVKSLVILAGMAEGFTILNLKTDINMADLKAANLSFNKDNKTTL